MSLPRPGPTPPRSIALSIAVAVALVGAVAPASGAGSAGHTIDQPAAALAEGLTVSAGHALTDDGAHVLRIRVANDAAEAFEVTALEWLIGGESGTSLVGATIPAGGGESLDVPIDNPSGTVAFTVTLGLVGHEPVSTAGTVRPLTNPVLSIPRQTVVVDGIVDDAVRALPGVDLLSEATPPTSGWSGPEDLSGTVWYTWDDDFVYFTAEIVDDIHDQPYTGDGIWGADGIQVTFGAGTPGESAGWSELGVALGPQGPSVWRWSSADGDTGTVAGAEYAVVRDETSATTTYELAVPWERLLPLRAEDRLISTSLVVNESDNEGRAGWFAWGGGIASGKNSALFNPARLDEEYVPSTGPDPWGVVPIAPTRLVDDAAVSGLGTPVCVTVSEAGIPDEATGVVANVTSSATTATGSAVVFPDGAGSAAPVATTVSFQPGHDVASAAFVEIGDGSRICYAAVQADGGTSRLTVDVFGYTLPGSGIELDVPVRLIDTRPGDGQLGELVGPVAPRQTHDVTVAGRGGIPANAVAVLANVTVSGATAPGGLAVFATGDAVPSTSVVDYVPGATVTGAAIVEIGRDGRISLYSDTAAAPGDSPVHVTIDVSGYVVAGNSAYGGLDPLRIVDTRADSAVGDIVGPLPAGVEHLVDVSGAVPRGATSVVLDVTAVRPSTTGALTVYPAESGGAVPGTSSIGYVPDRDSRNLVVVGIGDGRQVAFRSDQAAGGSVDLVVDVVGYFGGPTMVGGLLAARQLPDLGLDRPWDERRQELVDVLAAEAYGHTPPGPPEVRSEVLIEGEEPLAGGVTRTRVELSFDTPTGEFAFPVDYLVPAGPGPFPLVVLVAFRAYPSLSGVSIDLLAEHEIALAIVDYRQITPDNADLTAGLAGHYSRDEWDWGKLGMWAFGASRILDHAETLDRIDAERVAVMGHSRLGKVALWAAAQDERFAAAVSNNSGSGGAALARGNRGEQIADLVRDFPFWFSPSYAQWVHREGDMPFDQHFLLASLAPRLAYVASGSDDSWADPPGEFLGAAAASQAWVELGLPGLTHDGWLPTVGDQLHAGQIGYHVREGGHGLTQVDWRQILAFLDDKLTEAPAVVFDDVPESHPFFAEIWWLWRSGVATGTATDDGLLYRPSDPVSRQAFAAFLYRWAGADFSPEEGVQTFADVPASHPFYVEIEWLAAEGLSAGYADGTFGPNLRVSRQATAAFLHRLAGSPDPGADPPFADVADDHSFGEAIAWLAEVGVVAGYEDGTFGPSLEVSRQAIAAFLHRFDQLAQ